MASPVVATTINPFGDIVHQRRCFLAWRALGCEPRTVNSAKEASYLVATGFDADEILIAEEAETGLALFGKGIPRVLPALARLAALTPDRPAILVNADIYPAVRHAEALRFWLAEAPALGLTREDCTLLEAHTLLDNQPYRNGLDAFVFRPGVLAEVVRMLGEHAVSERMCFGIPGWDFLLGAVVRAPAIGGRLMDSTVLLHETHRQTYDGVGEFAHYIPAMTALGEVSGTTAETAAYEFFQTIVADCAASARQTAFVRAIAYARPQPALPPGDEARRVALMVHDIAPFVRWNTDFAAMTALAERQRRHPVFERTRHFFKTPAGPEHGFVEELLATLFQLACRRDDLAIRLLGADAPPPKGLAEIRRRTARDTVARQAAMAVLFGDLLIEKGLFSPLLYDYLALSAGSDPARAILRAIHALASGDTE